MNTFYKYNSETKIYDSAVMAEVCPLDATEIIPNAVDNKVLVFDFALQTWKAITKKESLELQIAHGVLALPTDCKAVDDSGEFIKKSEEEMVADGTLALSSIQERVANSINALCAEKIISGFESSALGEAHIYDSEDVDQINLIGSVAAGGTVYYKCQRKSDGVKDFLPHTNTQIKKVLNDGSLRKVALLQHCSALKNAVWTLSGYSAVLGLDITVGWV